MKIESFNYPQPIDGSNWKVYKLGSGTVMITSRGLELKDKDILRALSQYRKDRNLNKLSDTRIPFSRGGNSFVYKLNGTEILVKEGSDRHSLISAVERMDKLKFVIESGAVPRWIDLPDHYGVVEYNNKRGQTETFALIEKIDDGVTLEDALSELDTIGDDKRERVLRNLGVLTEDEKNEIQISLDEMKLLVNDALQEMSRNFPGSLPHQMTPDFHNGNILIERLKTPIGGKRFKFWIIDQ